MRPLAAHLSLLLGGLLIVSLPFSAYGQSENPTGLAGLVSIDRSIDAFEARAFQVRLERTLLKKPTHIIVAIDCDDGLSSSAEQIAKAIQSVSDQGIKTVAYVTGNATTVAALVAISCDRIIMAPGARFGAALPTGSQADEGEQNSRLRDGQERESDNSRRLETWKFGFETYASRHSYDELIVQAMLENRYGLVRIETSGSAAKKRVLYVSKREYEAMRDESAGLIQSMKLLAEPGELLVLDDVQAQEAGINLIQGLDTIEALSAELAKRDGHLVIENYQLSNLWWLQVIGFCHHTVVKIILFALGIVCLFIAFAQPGTGAAEVLAVLAFGAVFGSSYFAGFASYVEILVFVIGVALIAVEIFVIPGFGVTGVLGVLFVMLSFLLALQTFILPTTSAEWDIFSVNIMKTVFSFALTGLICGGLLRFFGQSRLLKRLVLEGPAMTLEAHVAGTSAAAQTLIGQFGVVHTTLRPSGEIRLGDEILDAISEDAYLEPGIEVVVVSRRGFSVMVRPVPKSLPYHAKGPLFIEPLAKEVKEQP